MMEEPDLPRGICRLCSEESIAAVQLRQLVQASSQHWGHVSDTLGDLEDATDETKVYYVFMSEGAPTIFKDTVGDVKTPNQAFQRLTQEIEQPRTTVRSYQRKTKMTCECPDCEKKFKLAYDLNKHLKKTKNRACVNCGKVVKRESLKAHLLKAHEKIVYDCQKCYKIFDKEVALATHMRELHRNPDTQCTACGAGFRNEKAIRAHMYCHTLFHCTSCKKSYENRKCFRHHKLSCKDETFKPTHYVCDYCNNVYDKKPSLRIHIIQKHTNVLPYSCTLCNKRTSTANHLASHMKTHQTATQRQVFKCERCDSVFTTELGYNLHQRIHTGVKPYQCDICGDRFLSASRRSDHIKRRHCSAKDFPHGCPDCPSRFVRPFELRKHIALVHKGEGKVKVEYEPVCPEGICLTCVTATMAAWDLRTLVKKSTNLWHEALDAIDTGIPDNIPSTVKSIFGMVKGDPLKFQLVKEHVGDPVNTIHRLRLRGLRPKAARKPRVSRNGPECSCPDCGKSFMSPVYLGIHLKYNSQKDVCLTCGEVLPRGIELVEHMYKQHAKRFHLCPKCPLVFQSESDLQLHSQSSHRSGIYCCIDCGQKFNRSSTYEIHAQMHTVRTCRACEKQFTNRNCYRVHRSMCEPEAKPQTKTLTRRQRVNIRDPAVFICDYCNKVYTSRPQLKNHIMWIHMDIRKFECQWCQKKFYTSTRLAEHTIVHTRERNFECDLCGAKLVTKMALTYHKRRHTGEKPYSCEDCGECFISSSRRSEHAKRRHGKGAFFKCNMCESGFARGHELVKHLKKIHKIKDPPQPERLKPISNKTAVVSSQMLSQ